MTEPTPFQPGDQVARPHLRQAANPATVKGGLAVALGLLVLLLPDLSVSVVSLAAGVGLGVSGLFDVTFAIRGRRRRRSGSRMLALLRGLTAIAASLLFLVSARDALTVLISLLGFYLLVRGVLTVVAGLVGKDRSRRGLRLAGGVTSATFGLLAATAPDTLAAGLVAGTAVAAILIGSILVAYGLGVARTQSGDFDPASATLAEILWDWVRSVDLGGDRREALAESLYFEAPGRASKLTAWWVMLLLSVAIATFAVLADSTAVVIGAMLVAPLMVPILGLAGALVNGWSRRAIESTLLVAAGTGTAVLLSYALSAWMPVAVAFDSNTQITSRVNPTLLDMLIAAAAGAAGAFATVNSRVANSIAGVAIAVALVPPLSVVGISLGAQHPDDARGAFLLFLTNFVTIVLSASTVFALGGFASADRLRQRARRTVLTIAPFAALAMLVMLPLIFTSEGLLVSSNQQRQAHGVVDAWLGKDSTLKVVNVTVADAQVRVDLIGPNDAPPIDELQQALSDEFGRPVGVTLSVAPVTVTQMDAPGAP